MEYCKATNTTTRAPVFNLDLSSIDIKQKIYCYVYGNNLLGSINLLPIPSTCALQSLIGFLPSFAGSEFGTCLDVRCSGELLHLQWLDLNEIFYCGVGTSGDADLRQSPMKLCPHAATYIGKRGPRTWAASS